VEEIVYSQYSGEKLIAVQEPDLGLFSESELRIMATVKERFKVVTAKEISELSHKEEGYVKTKNGEPISYSFANTMCFSN